MLVLAVQRNKTVFQIKGNSICVCVNSEKTASRFVVNDEEGLDKLEQRTSHIHSSQSTCYSKTTNLRSRITLETLSINEPLTKTIKCCFGVKIRD